MQHIHIKLQQTLVFVSDRLQHFWGLLTEQDLATDSLLIITYLDGTTYFEGWEKRCEMPREMQIKQFL